jgi:hypothetical protein
MLYSCVLSFRQARKMVFIDFPVFEKPLNHLLPTWLVFAGVFWSVGLWGDATYRGFLAHPQLSATTATGLGFVVLLLGFNAVGRLLRQYWNYFQNVDLEPVVRVVDPLCRQCRFFSGHPRLHCAVNPQHQPNQNCSEFEPGSGARETPSAVSHYLVSPQELYTLIDQVNQDARQRQRDGALVLDQLTEQVGNSPRMSPPRFRLSALTNFSPWPRPC